MPLYLNVLLQYCRTAFSCTTDIHTLYALGNKTRERKTAVKYKHGKKRVTFNSFRIYCSHAKPSHIYCTSHIEMHIFCQNTIRVKLQHNRTEQQLYFLLMPTFVKCFVLSSTCMVMAKLGHITFFSLLCFCSI